MSVEANLRVVDAYVDTLNARDGDRHFDLFTADVVYGHPSLDDPVRGRAAYRAKLGSHVADFSGSRLE